jgi:hypothetical protein
MKAKSLIRKWFLRQPTTRYNMVDYPSSEQAIQLESLDEPNLAQQSSENNLSASETRTDQAEQKSDNSARKPRRKKLKDGEIINTDIS